MLNLDSVSLIQSMLAPGLMISACGLLILGFNNKYSLVVNRIRSLEEEKRKLMAESNKEKLDAEQIKRLNSIRLQVEKFAFRIKLVRNGVFFYTLAVAFFILSSLGIGLQYLLKADKLETAAVVLFLMGMLSVLAGIYHAAKEVWKGYAIVKIEIMDSES